MVNGLPESEAERILRLLRPKVRGTNYEGPSNAYRLAELVRKWEAEDAQSDPERVEELRRAMESPEAVRFREAADWQQ